MIISIASGKGGTGKTTVATNLALSIDKALYLDCDVEEPNGHLFLKPKITREDKALISIPKIDEDKCNFCGKCQEVCSFNAIAVIPDDIDKKGSVLLFPHLCHGCGACTYLCPNNAINEIDKTIGIIESGGSGTVDFTHGRLNIGEIMSPAIIHQVKEHIHGETPVIIDAPPGTSCPVIAAVKGSDYCVLVTEPTPFGLSDLKLTVEVIRKLNIPFGIVINRSDIGDNKTEEYCFDEGISILLKIPFSREIATSYSYGEPIVKKASEYKKIFQTLYNNIKKVLL